MSADSRLETILEHVPVGVALLRPDGVVELANPAFLRLAGVGPGILGQKLSTVRTSLGTTLAHGADEAFSTGQPVFHRALVLESEGPLRRRVVDLEVVPTRGDGSRVEGALALLTDVTSRVTEEERARLFYEAFQQSSDAMEVTDAKGVLVDVNPAFIQIYGYARDEVIGQRPNVVSSSKTPRPLYDAMWRALLDPSVGHWSGEIVNRSKDGSEHPVLLSISAIRTPAGRVANFVGVAVDLSERRAWEQQAVRSERLASLGQLAAGVAHELNTPLANIMLVAESVQRKSKDPGLQDRMATIIGQTETAARIVRGLLDFSRRHEPQIRELNLTDVVRDAVGFLKGKQSEDVDLAEQYARGAIYIRGDRDQLIQVFTNIINNGYEAIEGTGEIRVRVRSDDGWGEVEIEDTGPGIPASVLPHIFEPFFTTKSDRNGTGLGLAICHGIVQSHGGTIDVDSREGAGARFLLKFPQVAHPGGHRPPSADVVP